MAGGVSNTISACCKRCKKTNLTSAVKCVKCTNEFHISCAKLYVNADVINKELFVCCAETEKQMDAEPDQDSFHDAADVLCTTDKLMSSKVFSYIIRQKDELIFELRDKIQILNEQIGLLKEVNATKISNGKSSDKVNSLKKPSFVKCVIEQKTQKQTSVAVPALKPQPVVKSTEDFAGVTRKGTPQQNSMESQKNTPQLINENDHDHEWKTSTTRRSRPKKNVMSIVGTRQNSEISTVQKKAYLYVTRLSTTTTAEALKKCLIKDLPEVNCELLPNKYESSHNRFKVTINYENLAKSENPNIWPQGTQISRFFHPRGGLTSQSNVQAMTDVKTGIGMAKAWVRLALEKKHLSKHLRTLLSDQTILRGQYKRNAFLRCEEEKEQFLYHLLSLNAVDYFCFTSTYPTTVIPYRIVIIPNKKGATTSANAWVVLSGTLSETRRIPVPKASLNFEYKHQNLGVLTTLRIGHDNSGLYAKWMIDYVIVRNDITGHAYKFPCGRWLGRGVDDSSTERLLVGNLLPTQVEGEEVSQTGSIGRTPPRCRSPGPPRTELKQSQIQHMLGDCVNNIVKWHYRRNSERNTTLAALLCGENGLVYCLENVFLLGFKSARMFVGKNYLWDYFVRVKEQFEAELMEESTGNRTASLERNHQETVAVWRCYCHLVEEIMTTSKALGKDGKFQLFICLSVREHLLHRMLVPMAACKVTLEMYEEGSFLRNRGLLTFLRQILLPLDELDVVLENSVTHGISSPSPHV